MHTLISYAAPPGPLARDALKRLELPHLAQLLQRLSIGARLLGQADDLTPVFERVLAQAEGLEGADGLIPWAAHEAHQLGLSTLHGLDGWAWITPCHWNVQSDHVEMSDPLQLALTPRDASALFMAMQPYFAEDGITLIAPAAGQPSTRWLAHGAAFAGLPTASLDRVAGRSVDAWIPRQPQAKPLRRLQNEMQMLLYTHPVNDQRTQFRLPIVNAFWVSGTGSYNPAAHAAHGSGSASPCSVRDALRVPALNDDPTGWSLAWQALDDSTLAHDVQRLELGEPVRVTLCSNTGSVTLEAQPLSAWARLRRRIAPLQPHQLLATL
jgi:hypothetical protein